MAAAGSSRSRSSPLATPARHSTQPPRQATTIWSAASVCVTPGVRGLQEMIAQPGHPGLVDLREQVGDRPEADEMGSGVHIEPRKQDKGPLVRARVRQGQLWVAAYLVIAGDQVDIKGTRTPPLVAHATERVFGVLAEPQDPHRRE